MQERPEFVGRPTRTTRAELVQESPRLVSRKASDDVSVVQAVQPEFSDIHFDMQGRRDYRGLRTVLDMSGQFRGRYLLTNAFEDPLFVLFRCPHPRTERGDDQALPAADLRLEASTPGVQESGKGAWLWTGTIPGHGSTTVEVSYRAASLQGVAYRVGAESGAQVKRVRVTLQRQDLAGMRFESGEGTRRSPEATTVWERQNFLAPDFFSASIEEGRHLHASLSQLLEIGPVLALLFLLAVSAVILARQSMTVIQVLTIAAGYALYFPLVVYLSANFSFAWALLIAVTVPGALLVNYARWLLGAPLGLAGGAGFLLLYQVFPTLAAFAGWNRGMVLLCLGVLTLGVLINLQNRALRQGAVAAAGLLVALALPGSARGAEVQVLLPAELAGRLSDSRGGPTNALVAHQPVSYHARQAAAHLVVEAHLEFNVLRPGETPVPLFSLPVHLQPGGSEMAESAVARLVSVTNRYGLLALRAGPGALDLTYFVPLERREGRQRAEVPLLSTPSGTLRLQTSRGDAEAVNGSLWSKHRETTNWLYEVGVAGLEALVLEWHEPDGGTGAVGGQLAEAGGGLYGIGLARAQHLTIIGSDGSCTHFTEVQMAAGASEEFRLKLPDRARLISASVDGVEIASPIVQDQLCRLRLPDREARRSSRQLSFRIAYPAARLGFVGTLELALPELAQTAGLLEWTVALPGGFGTQVLSSSLERQSTPADLGRFGDYGRILKTQPHTSLAKTLAPPAPVNLVLRYRQTIPGFFEARGE